MIHWSDYTNFGIALFALLNPSTKIPFVLAVSQNNARAVQILAAASTLTVVLVLVVAHFVGVAALQVLGTSLPSFQIGGGIIVLLSGLKMLFDSSAGKEGQGAAEKIDSMHYVGLAVSPLGIPMLAGPGAITKVIVDTHPGTGIENDLHSIGLIVTVALGAGMLLAASGFLMRLFGKNFFSVVGRVAGLIIVAVAVEMIVKGISMHVRVIMG